MGAGAGRCRRLKAPNTGSWLWLAVGAFITGVDVWAVRTGRETLSMAFWRGVQCPKRRPVVVAVNAYLLAHLYHAIPQRWDPLRVLADPVKIVVHG